MRQSNFATDSALMLVQSCLFETEYFETATIAAAVAAVIAAVATAVAAVVVVAVAFVYCN